MHGDISQQQREYTLKRFKENRFPVLVATDVASRGIHIPDIELVVQLEPPKDTEAYITGLAGQPELVSQAHASLYSIERIENSWTVLKTWLESEWRSFKFQMMVTWAQDPWARREETLTLSHLTTGLPRSSYSSTEEIQRRL